MAVRFARVGKSIYRSKQWQAVRLEAKRRDGWACVQCGSKGRIEVDHVKALRHGGDPFDLSNLQCLCPGCHARKTRLEIGLGRENPERDAWKTLLRDMQRNPSSKGNNRA